MPLSFKTNTVTVGDLFSGSNIFRMPIFQRPFSWNEETALELLGDIVDAMDRSERGRSGERHQAGQLRYGGSRSQVS